LKLNERKRWKDITELRVRIKKKKEYRNSTNKIIPLS
jgi:hypothetical protein